jgi:sodium-dependent dicarboxylate transporter 2/3/5
MITHGLDRRFAFIVLSIPGVARSTYGVIIAFGAIAASISAFISNTTTAAMLLPIGLDPLVPALAAVFGASFGFMMPVSTPQNAVVYGSGMIPITKMVRSGLVFDVIGLILIVLLIPVMAGLILA